MLTAARRTRLGQVARMPDGSLVKQQFFVEGMVGPGGVVGRPRSRWRDRAVAALRTDLVSVGEVGLVWGDPRWDGDVAALSPVLSSQLAGWG
eukprot:354687-Chlamydomonas_euryale.AAC.2